MNLDLQISNWFHDFYVCITNSLKQIEGNKKLSEKKTNNASKKKKGNLIFEKKEGKKKRK